MPLPFLIASAVLLLIGLLARVAADFMPTVVGRNHHLLWAALLCILAALVWGIRLVLGCSFRRPTNEPRIASVVLLCSVLESKPPLPRHPFLPAQNRPKQRLDRVV